MPSHVAADQVAPFLKGQRMSAYQAVKAHPGRTSKDLAEVANLDRYMLARRLPEVEQMGAVERAQRDSKEAIWFVKSGGG